VEMVEIKPLKRMAEDKLSVPFAREQSHML
jgi:hypothetical protein